MGSPRITDEELAQITKLFHAGATVASVAKQLKRSESVIAARYRALKNGNGEAEYDWTEIKIPIAPTATHPQKQLEQILAANRSLTLRNHELLKALKIIRELSDVEIPF